MHSFHDDNSNPTIFILCSYLVVINNFTAQENLYIAMSQTDYRQCVPKAEATSVSSLVGYKGMLYVVFITFKSGNIAIDLNL